jgi:hypothetical protein
MSPLPALIPLLLPVIPSLIASIMDVVDQFQAPPGTPEEEQLALRKFVEELHVINAQVQAAPLPGDPLPGDEPTPAG